MNPRLSAIALEEHPLRQSLNNEFHARPPVAVEGAALVSHLVFKHAASELEKARRHVGALCQGHVCEAFHGTDGHVMIEAGAFRVRWEAHTEFSSYTFFRRLSPGEVLPADATAFDAVQPDWLSATPGRLIVATQVEVRMLADCPHETALARCGAEGRAPVAARAAEGAALVVTDFRVENGFSRYLVVNGGLGERQAGRMVQRLVEIETYRVMSMLALPVAKEVGRWLYEGEKGLAALTDRIGAAGSPEDERGILHALSGLAAQVEHSVARTTFRFGAARAYHGLVMQRIGELREVRVPGYPTFEEFMERRLRPAMATCEAIARRQEELSSRVARASQLLRARIEVELERQNQALLGEMNKRARLQLRLQETVEGLSVVVLTYYGSQLVNYLAKGSKDWHHLSPDVVTAISIPVIAGFVAWGTARMRRALAREEGGAH